MRIAAGVPPEVRNFKTEIVKKAPPIGKEEYKKVEVNIKDLSYSEKYK